MLASGGGNAERNRIRIDTLSRRDQLPTGKTSAWCPSESLHHAQTRAQVSIGLRNLWA